MDDRCECGAPLTEPSCEELYHRLLALDHQREQPWAAFHAINVACYLLQHPGRADVRYRDRQRAIVASFVPDGLVARDDQPTTIRDVAVDGTFPAAGFADRVTRWAGDVLLTTDGDAP